MATCGRGANQLRLRGERAMAAFAKLYRVAQLAKVYRVCEEVLPITRSICEIVQGMWWMDLFESGQSPSSTTGAIRKAASM